MIIFNEGDLLEKGNILREFMIKKVKYNKENI